MITLRLLIAVILAGVGSPLYFFFKKSTIACLTTARDFRFLTSTLLKTPQNLGRVGLSSFEKSGFKVCVPLL